MKSFDDMNRMFEEMDRMFDQLRTTWWGEYDGLHAPRASALDGETADGSIGVETASTAPAGTTASLEDEGDEYVFVMDMPGFEKSDIDLAFDDGLLSVRARADVESDSDVGHSLRSRRVAKRVTVPAPVLEAEITASYHNGVLEVHLPLEEESDESHTIDIE